MSRFEARRWAEALVDAAGTDAAAAISFLEAIAAGYAAAGRTIRGTAAADRFYGALGRAFPDATEGARYGIRIAVLLARRGRLDRAGEVAALAAGLLQARSGILRFRAESAFPLSADEREKLRAALARAIPGRGGNPTAIVLDERVDPELLGGIRVGIGSLRIDGTLARRMEAQASALGAAKRGGAVW